MKGVGKEGEGSKGSTLRTPLPLSSHEPAPRTCLEDTQGCGAQRTVGGVATVIGGPTLAQDISVGLAGSGGRASQHGGIEGAQERAPRLDLVQLDKGKVGWQMP